MPHNKLILQRQHEVDERLKEEEQKRNQLGKATNISSYTISCLHIQTDLTILFFPSACPKILPQQVEQQQPQKCKGSLQQVGI